MCVKCNDTGSTNNDGYLDCVHCDSAMERAMFGVWLVESDLRSQVNESAAWVIYQYGKKQNEKLQSS